MLVNHRIIFSNFHRFKSREIINSTKFYKGQKTKVKTFKITSYANFIHTKIIDFAYHQLFFPIDIQGKWEILVFLLIKSGMTLIVSHIEKKSQCFFAGKSFERNAHSWKLNFFFSLNFYRSRENFVKNKNSLG